MNADADRFCQFCFSDQIVDVKCLTIVPCPKAYSSASPELSAIVPCALLPEETVGFKI